MVTYGEAYTKQKNSLSFNTEKLYHVAPLGRCRDRMKYQDAGKYYTKRSREVFAALGMANKKEIKKKSEKKLDYFEFIDFEVRLPTEFKRVRNATRQMINRESKRLISLGFYKETI